MRSYGKITHAFWQSIVKPWRGDADAITVAVYLATSPHSTMTGLYHCPLMFIAYETGLSPEGASKALQRVSEGAFCTYDEVHELVWVHDMAAIEMAPQLKPGDKRVTAIVNQLATLPNCQITRAFYDRYKIPFCLEGRPELASFLSTIEAPSKPLRSQIQVQVEVQVQDQQQVQHQSPIQERREGSNTRTRESNPAEPVRSSFDGQPEYRWHEDDDEQANEYARAKGGA